MIFLTMFNFRDCREMPWRRDEAPRRHLLEHPKVAGNALEREGRSEVDDVGCEEAVEDDEEIESFTAENFEADVATNDEPKTEQEKDEL